MKSSNFYGFFRELMDGANQCRRNGEWTSEPQTEPQNGVVGFGENLIVTWDRYSSSFQPASISVKWADFLANEGGTTGLPSFLDGGPFCFEKIKNEKSLSKRSTHFDSFQRAGRVRAR